MRFASRLLTADAWLRRLDQVFDLKDARADLQDFLGLEVLGMRADLRPCQVYDPKILTFRGTYDVTLARTCGVSLEPFHERLQGPFERSFTLSPSAPALPDGAEEAEEFPFAGVALLPLLGDEIALSAAAFPRKPGAKVPDHRVEAADADQDQRPNPFAALAALKRA